jgi:hypothetical protein
MGRTFPDAEASASWSGREGRRILRRGWGGERRGASHSCGCGCGGGWSVGARLAGGACKWNIGCG